MDELWKAIAELAAETHTDRIMAAAEAIAKMESVEEFGKVENAFGPDIDKILIDRFYGSWKGANGAVGPIEVSVALKAAASAVTLMESRGALELVWTGPKTDLVPTRQTEQAMLEVIESALHELFLVAYVFYKAPSVVDALNAAIKKGVEISVLLESPLSAGGNVTIDGMKAMRAAVPGIKIYHWNPSDRKDEGDTASFSVHAKCAVADEKTAFITSANLTTAALERNMELGVLVKGGQLPAKLHGHLKALIATKVIEKI